MRILVLADVESKYLWDYFEKEKLDGIDLILSCGDLKPQYLSFLASFSKVPILYVHGNHDDCYEIAPPDGCICIENKIYVYRGVRIMGLGGSIRYNNGKNQYTQAQMKQRVRKMWLSIKKHKELISCLHIHRRPELMMVKIMFIKDLTLLLIYWTNISQNILYMVMFIRVIAMVLRERTNIKIQLL